MSPPFDRINREQREYVPVRRGQTRAEMEEELRRAVANTVGGTKHVAPPAPPAAQPERLVAVAKPSAPRRTDAGVRYVEPVAFKGNRSPILSAAPKLRMADPTVLRIEASYQRDLSRKSHALIQRIVANWDWAKFKPPVCALTESGLFVIDGQHTAIAAATHPEIQQIPILIVEAAEIERRAEAFVAHNRDRIAMTAGQIFHGEVAAGLREPAELMAAIERAGGSVPRLPVKRDEYKPGQVTAIGETRKIFRAGGAALLERVIRIAVASKLAPANLTLLRAIHYVLAEAALSQMPDSKIAGAITAIDKFEAKATARGSAANKDRGWGGAQLLAERLRAPR